MQRIAAPILGLLDLSRGQYVELATNDRAALAPFFNRVVESTTEIPKCDVLFLYCTILDDGSIEGVTSVCPLFSCDLAR